GWITNPLPDSGAWNEPASSRCGTVSSALLRPAACGAKRTWSVHRLFGERVVREQPSRSIRKSRGCAPVIFAEPKCISVRVSFMSVTVCGSLSRSTGWRPKSRLSVTEVRALACAASRAHAAATSPVERAKSSFLPVFMCVWGTMQTTVSRAFERILDGRHWPGDDQQVATATTGLIPRPRLAQALNDAFDGGSVLLVAGPGYGKTMGLEEALATSGRRSLWIGCGDVGREAVRMLMALVEGLRTTVPGLADVVGDRLAAGLEPVNVRSASAALLPELDRLLSEPLVIVFDDAEELEGA